MPTYGLSFIYMPIIAVLCLSACCTPGIRPEDANIFQAACGISTGDFDRQVEAAQDEAQKSESMLETEKTRSQRLEGELAVRKQERQRLEYQLARLIESTSEYEAQILAIRTETDDDLRQRENWLEQIARINAEMEHLQSQQSKLSIELFQQKIEALKQEIEVLRRISLEQ
jgi:chromosome segregation ATPase